MERFFVVRGEDGGGEGSDLVTDETDRGRTVAEMGEGFERVIERKKKRKGPRRKVPHLFLLI